MEPLKFVNCCSHDTVWTGAAQTTTTRSYNNTSLRRYLSFSILTWILPWLSLSTIHSSPNSLLLIPHLTSSILLGLGVSLSPNSIHSSRSIVARFQQKDTVMFVLRVMVGAIILYDHVHPVGAFNRKSSIDVSIHKHFSAAAGEVLLCDVSKLLTTQQLFSKREGCLSYFLQLQMGQSWVLG